MRILFFFLLIFCREVSAQEHTVFLFSKDSLGKQYPRWIIVNGDKPEYASAAFDDRTLPMVYPGWLRFNKDSATRFQGIGWMRLHFRVDSSLAGKPLAFGISHNGASVLYLDGNKIYERGKVGDAAHSKYYDPQYYPVPIAIPDTREHILAMRYANWNYNNHNRLYDEEPPGFQFMLKDGQSAIDEYVSNNDFSAISCCILFGVFAVLAIIHFLFFLYYRSERTNLWFSLFCGSLAALLILPYVGHTVSNPRTVLIIGYYSFFLVVLGCFALSGFLDKLFSRKHLRFKIISAFYLLATLVYIFVPSMQGYPVFGLVAVATLEAIFVITAAIIRKVPGARIIGGGLSLFILLLLFILGVAVVAHGANVHFSGTSGAVIFAAIAIALLSIPISLSAYLALNFGNVSRDLKKRLQQVQELSKKTSEQEAEKQRMLEHQKELLEQEVAERTKEVMQQKNEIEQQHVALIEEKKKSDDLLLNILPSEVAEELKQKGHSAARHYEQVTVLFTDFVDFTGTAEQMSPQELVQELNECFTAFDAIIERAGLEKIKTIGDAYMAVCGLPVSDERHAYKAVQAALEIREFVESRRSNKHAFGVRIGINSGPVVAGIIGVKKFAYDIWGDTVNTAARMEQHGETDRINISQSTYELVKDSFECEARGRISAKHKGDVEMYFVMAATATVPSASIEEVSFIS